MKILISGSSGLIGRELTAKLKREGHQVVKLVRKETQGEIYWDPSAGIIDTESL